MIDLRLGNCLDIMPEFVSGSIDAVITDPPYGLTQLEWDSDTSWEAFWKVINRLSGELVPVIMFSLQPFTTDLINSNRESYRYEIIWHKTMPTGCLDANRRPLRAHENIIFFSRKFRGSTYNPQKNEWT